MRYCSFDLIQRRSEVVYLYAALEEIKKANVIKINACSLAYIRLDILIATLHIALHISNESAFKHPKMNIVILTKYHTNKLSTQSYNIHTYIQQ